MQQGELLRFSIYALREKKLRTSLSMLGIAIGISAVILLTSLGEGVRHYVITEFTQFGTTILAINPGRTTTYGTAVGIFGSTKPLAIEDGEALRRISGVQAIVPLVQGNAEVEAYQKSRRTTVLGVGADLPQAFRMSVASGNFLPADDPFSPRAFAVLGSKLREELFEPTESPLGKRIRIGGERFQVIGVMESKGQIIGFDMDDTVYIPAARGLSMFNREGLMEIDVLYSEQTEVNKLVKLIRESFIKRHGRDDITITTQQQMLDVMDSILDLLTFAIGAMGGISLFVGAIGILTIMTISVSERRHEIGLLRALGSKRREVMHLFLSEAILLASLGGIFGLVLGLLLGLILHLAVPELPLHPSPLYILLAELTAIVIGIISGIIPAWQAAKLDPAEVLHSE
jgi:putative ABC transport system permease protein